MTRKSNQRILGMTPTQLAALAVAGGFVLCITLSFGGYIIYEANRPLSLPTAGAPASKPTLITQPPTATQAPAQPTETATLKPRATFRPTLTNFPTITPFVIPTLDVSTATRIPTKVATQTLTPAPINLGNLSKCEQTIYDNYGFVLKYPAIWGCDQRSDLLKSTGPDGFMEITLKQVLRTAKDFCESQVQGRFGKNPTMEILQVDSRPACLIFPSADQASKYRQVSLLVVEYAQSIKKDTLLLLSADKKHIRGLMNSLRFVR